MGRSGTDRRREKVPHRPESRPRGMDFVGGAFQVFDHAGIAYGTRIDLGTTGSTIQYWRKIFVASMC